MQQDGISIKGIRQGLLIGLGEGSYEEQLLALERRLVVGATFFQGGHAALDVGERALDAGEIERAWGLLSQHDVELWAVLSSSDQTALAAARMGLAVNLELGERLERVERAAAAADEPGDGTLLVERTLRAGQKVHHPGHVVIIGDVHAGAEVVAGGHVVVWGKLHGMVHAGAFGDAAAVACALDLSPTQLRIAGHIARTPDEKRHRSAPEMARVRDDRIEAVAWHHK